MESIHAQVGGLSIFINEFDIFWVIREHFLVWEEIEGGSTITLLTQSEGRQGLSGRVAQDPLGLIPLNTWAVNKCRLSSIWHTHSDNTPKSIRPTLGNVLNVPLLYGKVPHIDLVSLITSQYTKWCLGDLGDGPTPGLTGVVSSSNLILILSYHKHSTFIRKYQYFEPKLERASPDLTGSWGLSPAQVPDSTCSPSMYIL